MMDLTLFRLITSALFPVLAAVLFYLLERKSAFGRWPNAVRQILLGLVFGGIAALATEFGIPTNGAIVNVRSAAPLTAGLVFGGPAGIIAGVLGGIHRFFATYWNPLAGPYTQVACTIATVLAGLLGAACRRLMFDNKKASWFYGLAIGITMEVLHMLLVFLTNMDDINKAFEVVAKCSPTMIPFNGISVMLSLLFVSLIGRERIRKPRGQRQISQMFQNMLLICVVLAFAVTCLFTISMQTRIANEQAQELLSINLTDVQEDINAASDENLLDLTLSIRHQVTPQSTSEQLVALSEEYGGPIINLVDGQGMIRASTNADFLGFDMHSGEQSGAFLSLLNGEDTYVQSYQPLSYDSTVSHKYAGAALSEGFVQVGYDSTQFHAAIEEEIVSAAQNRHIGRSGFVIVCDESLNIISTGGGQIGENRNLEEGVEPFTVFRTEVRGEQSYCMYTTAEGFYIITTIPAKEAMQARNIAIQIIVYMEILVFAALFAHIYFLIKRLVVDNIHKVNHSLAQITGGNLDVTVDVRDNEEFASLSDDINTTVSTLKKYIEEAEARIDAELEFARQIQHSSLPGVFPPFPHRRDFEIYALMDAAKEVGGDFYDFYLLQNNVLVFLVADVSGKGIPGAMFMMRAKTLIKGLVESGKDIDAVFTEANAQLCENNEAGMFVTAWMGALELETGTLSYVNAGHNPPLIRKKDGAFEYLRTKPNFILAGMEGVRYQKHTLALSPGDEIFLYTDGVTEATDANQCLYGEDRLAQVLSRTDKKHTHELCSSLRADIDAFVGDAPQFDDITMLSVRLNHLERYRTIITAPSFSSVSAVSEFVRERMEKYEPSPKTQMNALIAVDEIYSNILHHSGAHQASVSVKAQDGELSLTFEDDGTPFDPTALADPDVTLSAEERSIGGLGIFMVKKSAKRMEYAYRDGKNVLCVVYAL